MLFTKNNMFVEYEGFYYLPYGFVNKHNKEDALYYPSGIFKILMNNNFTLYNISLNFWKIEYINRGCLQIIPKEDKELKNILRYRAIISSFSSIDVFRLTKNDMSKLRMIAVVE